MITPEQCRSGRAWLDWSQEELAEHANVSLSTVRDFEKGRRVPIANNIEAIQESLEKAGVFAVSEFGEPAGIRVEHRIKERDTYLPVLEYLDEMPDGFMKTSDLILALEGRFQLSSEDLAILEGRSDTRFSQIVRNIVSHREAPGNLIRDGWAEYDKAKRGLRITPEGRKHLVAEQERLKSGL
jgi:transcriptional regulator with XRE-family HTH domain